jgi:hypothetical protein
MVTGAYWKQQRNIRENAALDVGSMLRIKDKTNTL